MSWVSMRHLERAEVCAAGRGVLVATAGNPWRPPWPGRWTGTMSTPPVAQPPAAAQVLIDFVPTKEFFVGIDSDGCAFDAMDIKHQECFTPTTIKRWHLQAASTLARETAIFVNLGSTTRGQNRWIALARVFQLLSQRPEVTARGVTLPSGEELRAFIASGYPLSDKGIEEYAAAHPGPEIERCIAWGKAVNAAIADMVHGCPPFPGVREAFEAMQPDIDCMTVSATPMEALEREWHEHGLAAFMKVIAGQEMGTKAMSVSVWATMDSSCASGISVVNI